MIVIGIDTGGTCTDAVIYDLQKRKVLSYGKTLTTKKDLKEGILKALRALEPALVSKASHICLSTTLATNACVEGKGGRAKLVFIGLKPAYVERMAGTYGLPPVSEISFLAGDAKQSESKENRPDWDDFRREIKDAFVDYDSVAIVQINPKYNDGKYEKQAEAIIQEELGIPCVRGYDLYQEINVQKRGATALLNARLLPVMKDFFQSIDASLAELGLDLPILVVKSDGSIMSRAYAIKRPVETLLCGPAASIIGAMELSARRNCLIVDMGGTTSDVALIENGKPVIGRGGISIGSWKTMVKGVSIDTFALGGDSLVVCEDKEIYLDKRRVMPLCMAASAYPQITKKLSELTDSYSVYSYPAEQFLLLLNRPENPKRYFEYERKLIEALENGPLSLGEAANAISVSPYIFNCRRLEDEGVIIRIGVTPTDVMHILGDYREYDEKASLLGLTYLHFATGRTIEGLCLEIYDLAKKRLYENLVRILAKYEAGTEFQEEELAIFTKLSAHIFDRFRRDGFHFLESNFRAKLELVGIGAPTGIFLREVANLLSCKVHIPEYAKIANAIGAAVGSVSSEYVVKIEPCTSKKAFGKYMVTGGEEIQYFEYYDRALDCAKEIARERAQLRAIEQGASEDIEITTEVFEDYYDLAGEGSRLFVETRVVCSAREK